MPSLSFAAESNARRAPPLRSGFCWTWGAAGRLAVFEVIPAIDIRGGKCVRLYQGDYAQETVYGDDPVEMALKWQSEGATRLHVVDLDAARSGEPVNLPIVARICETLSIPVQM